MLDRIPLLNHHLGWPTGGKGRYKLPRIFQQARLKLDFSFPWHPVIPPEVWCLIGIFFQGPNTCSGRVWMPRDWTKCGFPMFDLFFTITTCCTREVVWNHDMHPSFFSKQLSHHPGGRGTVKKWHQNGFWKQHKTRTNPPAKTPQIHLQKFMKSQTLNVWYIYLHLSNFYGKCR